MASFTFVGVSSIATTAGASPDDFAVPVPSGTQVGDLLVVGFYGGYGAIPTDARLTGVQRTGLADPYASGAYGIATDLSDVTVQMTDFVGIPPTYPGLITVAALRGIGAPDSTYAYVQGDPSDQVFVETPGYVAAIAFVCDPGDATVEVGTSATWTDRGEVSVYDGSVYYYSLRCLTYDNISPIPELTLTDAGISGSRSGFYLMWESARGSHLRQRQSPVRTPSRVRGVDLRQRQTTRI